MNSIPTGSKSFRAKNGNLFPKAEREPHLDEFEVKTWKRRDIERAFGISSDEDKLNKTEKAFLAHIRSFDHIRNIGIQNVTLKLAHDCRLTPDFNYETWEGNHRIVFVDVKGFQREDALIKMKVAARTFPWARFLIVKKTKTGWNTREVKP